MMLTKLKFTALITLGLAATLSSTIVSAQQSNRLQYGLSTDTNVEIPSHTRITKPSDTAVTPEPEPNPEPEPDPEPELVTRDYVVGSFTNIETVDGYYSDSEGNPVSLEQVQRIVYLTQQGHAQLIGFRMDVEGLVPSPPPAPNHGSGSDAYYARIVEEKLPITTTVPLSVNVTYQSWDYEHDNDRTRFVFMVKDDSKESFGPHLIDTRWFDINKTDIKYYRDYTIPVGSSWVQLWGGCWKKAGSVCSAEIQIARMMIEPYLPVYGSTITFTENPVEE